MALREWVKRDEKGRPDRARLTRLDLTSGKVQVLGDLGEEDPHSWNGELACARNGRIALGEEGGGIEPSQIVLWEPDGKRRPIVNSSKDIEPLEWSPDSRFLLCGSVDVDRARRGEWAIAYTVATEVAGAKMFREQSLTSQSVQRAAWGADASAIFAVALSPSGAIDKSTLLSIGWPSRTAKTLLTGISFGLDVAEKTGIAIVFVSEGRHLRVWRVQSGKAPERTPVSVDSPQEVSVSPDGRYLAMVLGGSTSAVVRGFRFTAGDGGIVVYDTANGLEFRVSETAGKRVGMLHWALSGGALIFTVFPASVKVDDLGHELWLVHMPWAARDGRGSAPPRPALVQSRGPRNR